MASITKRGKKWRARASYIDAKGIRQQPSKTFDTKKAATEWATRLENQIFDGSDINAGKMFFPDYFKTWIEVNKKDNVRPATYYTYQAVLKFVEKGFENVPMDRLTTALVQKQLNEYGKTHAISTVKAVLTKVKMILHEAYIDGIIKRDIFSRLRATGQDVDRHDNFLNANEFIQLQKYLYSKSGIMNNYPFYLMALIALETGMRIGEVQALTIDDITDNTVAINKSYSMATQMMNKPKTITSNRTVSISDSLYNVIHSYSIKSNSKNLFDKKITSNNISKYMEKLTQDAGVPFIHFHGLRHSHVSYLLYSGVDIQYISKRVGHANISITMNVYSHMLKEKEQSQSELTLKILNYSDQ